MQFFKLFIALLVPFFSLCVYAQDNNLKLNESQFENSVVKFDYLGKGKFYSNANGASSEGVRIELAANYEKYLLENLKLSFKGGFIFESDRTQDFYVDKISPSRVDLEHALVQWTPKKHLTFQAGALNQLDTVQRKSLLGQSSTFPAAMQEYIFKSDDNIKVGLKLEQAIPTSRTYSTRVVESEPTPRFFFEDLFYTQKLSAKSKLNLNIGYYSFYDLPSLVAEDSGVHGNIVASQGPYDSYFVYPFQGWSLKAGYCYCFLENYSFKLEAEYLNNIKAPANYAEARSLLFTVNQYKETSQTDYNFKLFNQQKQAAPSFYLDNLFGYSNRKGFGLGIKHKFIKNDFYIGFEWVESRLIEITPEQADQRTIQIYLGVDNA